MTLVLDGGIRHGSYRELRSFNHMFYIDHRYGVPAVISHIQQFGICVEG